AGWKDATETARLTASDGATNEGFGGSVGISGGTIAVSAPAHKVGDKAQQGAGYVFVKPAAGWKDATQTAELFAADGAAGDNLGNGNPGVSVAGDTVAIGAPNKDVGASVDQGAVYMFERPGATWSDSTEQIELKPNDGAAGDFFGFSVSLADSTNTLGVGALFHQVGQTKQGAAYVFVKPPV